MEYSEIKCPNCAVKIKIDRDKKYQDCPECKYEFRTEDVLKENTTQDLGSGNSLLANLKKSVDNS